MRSCSVVLLDNDCFICSTRNEKYLAAVAAGKWVLHKSYLEASREAGFFVDESCHEWGQEVPGEPHNKLAAAARRWRLKLCQERAVRQILKSRVIEFYVSVVGIIVLYEIPQVTSPITEIWTPGVTKSLPPQ